MLFFTGLFLDMRNIKKNSASDVFGNACRLEPEESWSGEMVLRLHEQKPDEHVQWENMGDWES